MMYSICLKRVYEQPEKSDGFRVLVDRLWPRGIKKEDLPYDLWDKSVTPSNELRKWVHESPDTRWAEFTEKYQAQLDESPLTAQFVETLKKHPVITFLYASKNEKQNHAQILASYVKKMLTMQQFF